MSYRFEAGSRLIYRGKQYLLRNCSSCASELLELWELGERSSPIVFSRKELEQFYLSGELYFSDKVCGKEESPPVRRFDSEVLSEEEEATTKRRLAYIDEILVREPEALTTHTLSPIIAEVSLKIGDPAPPHWVTVTRWLHRAKYTDRDVNSLIPRTSRGNRSKRLPREVSDLVSQHIETDYLTKERRTVREVWKRIARRVDLENEHRPPDLRLPVPSYETLRTIISTIDPPTRTEGRYGKRAAEREHRPILGQPLTSRALERVEIDHTQLDLYVVDEDSREPLGRPYITSAIDHYTRALTGFYISFSPPSTLSVMQCLRVAILPKAMLLKSYKEVECDWDVYGVPETLVIDNGKEFHSRDFDTAMTELGVQVQYSPPREPWYKGIIERHFRTLNTALLHQQKGSTYGGDYKRSDYNPSENAVISFDALVKSLFVWAVDVYQQRQHKGISRAPARAWADAAAEYPPTLGKSVRDVIIALSQSAKRSISRRGIEFQGLFYNSEELATLRAHLGGNLQVTFKYDALDISFLEVLHPDRREYFRVPAVHASYAANKTLFQHQTIRRFLRRRAAAESDEAQLLRAEARVREILDRDSKPPRAKKSTNSKIARFEGKSSSPPLEEVAQSGKKILDSITGLSEIGDLPSEHAGEASQARVIKGKTVEAKSSKKTSGPIPTPIPYVDTDSVDPLEIPEGWGFTYTLGHK